MIKLRLTAVRIRTRKTNEHLRQCFESVMMNLIGKTAVSHEIEIACNFREVDAIVRVKMTSDGKGCDRGIHRVNLARRLDAKREMVSKNTKK